MFKFKEYCLFSLRIWSAVSSNWLTNGFWWLLTLILYLLLNFDISSLTVGILRSRCIVSLVTYQDASIKHLRATWLLAIDFVIITPNSIRIFFPMRYFLTKLILLYIIIGIWFSILKYLFTYNIYAWFIFVYTLRIVVLLNAYWNTYEIIVTMNSKVLIDSKLLT